MNRTNQIFPLGQTLATPGALDVLAAAYPDGGYRAMLSLLWRHAEGDWGDLDPEDKAANDRALVEGTRIFSAYQLPTGEKLWVITEWDRSATTILRPEDY